MLDTTFTEEQWLSMLRVEMSLPVPLHTAYLYSPFVYDREWGVFYTPTGRHVWAMATLYAFHHGYHSVATYMDVTEQYDANVLADRWIMEYAGTAFLSSVGRSIIAGKPENLNTAERLCFRERGISYLEEN